MGTLLFVLVLALVLAALIGAGGYASLESSRFQGRQGEGSRKPPEGG